MNATTTAGGRGIGGGVPAFLHESAITPGSDCDAVFAYVLAHPGRSFTQIATGAQLEVHRVRAVLQRSHPHLFAPRERGTGFLRWHVADAVLTLIEKQSPQHLPHLDPRERQEIGGGK